MPFPFGLLANIVSLFSKFTLSVNIPSVMILKSFSVTESSNILSFSIASVFVSDIGPSLFSIVSLPKSCVLLSNSIVVSSLFSSASITSSSVSESI